MPYLWKLPVSRLQATTLLLVVRPKGEPVPPYTTITPLNIRADVKGGFFFDFFFLCIIFNTASSAAPAKGGTGSTVHNHHPSEHQSRRKRGIFLYFYFIFYFHSTLLHLSLLRFHCVGGCSD